MVIKRIFLAACFIAACVGCTEKELNQKKLNSFVQDPDNGLLKTYQEGDLKIEVSVYPSDLVALLAIGEDARDRAKWVEAKARYDSQMYFIMSLSRNDDELLGTHLGKEKYSELVNMLSFGLNDKVYLTTNKPDTLTPVDYRLERTYQMAGATRLLFAFNKQRTENRDVRFNIKEFGLNIGLQYFDYQRSDLAAIPSLTPFLQD